MELNGSLLDYQNLSNQCIRLVKAIASRSRKHQVHTRFCLLASQILPIPDCLSAEGPALRKEMNSHPFLVMIGINEVKLFGVLTNVI